MCWSSLEQREEGDNGMDGVGAAPRQNCQGRLFHCLYAVLNVNVSPASSTSVIYFAFYNINHIFIFTRVFTLQEHNIHIKHQRGIFSSWLAFWKTTITLVSSGSQESLALYPHSLDTWDFGDLDEFV